MADPILTPEFRVSFPAIFKPDRVDETSPLKYAVTMLFDTEAQGTDAFKALRAQAAAAAKDRWGDKIPKGLRSPFRKGEEKDHIDGYADGIVFVRATTEQQPELIDRNKQEIISERDFYAGCHARAFVVAFAYDKGGNKGVSFGLRSVQKLRDGEAFGGGGSYADKFDDLPGTGDDNTGGAGSGAAPAAEGDDDFLS